MKTFEYRGFDAHGQRARGLVEALSVKHARERLAADGLLAERVAPTGRSLAFLPATRAMVYRELAALLEAGLPMERALEMLIQASDLKALRSLLAGVRDRVREGVSLADALEEASPSVSAFEHSVVRAADQAAAVAPALEGMAAFIDEQEKLRERVRAALIYPALVFTVGVCVAILMLGLLVPRTQEIVQGMGGRLPWLTRAAMALSGATMRWGWLVLLAPLAAVLYARARLRRDASLCSRWDRRLFSLPLWGPGYALLVVLRFARTLAMTLRGGVPLIDAFVLAGRATGSAWVAELAATEAEQIRHGGRLSDAVRRIPPLAQPLSGWIEIGEASGGLPRLMDAAGDRAQSLWDRFTSHRLVLLEPLLVMIVGSFVLLVTLAVLLPVIGLSRAIGP